MQHIARLLKTIELLSRPQGATMNQLVQAHGLSKRQIQRWILQVQEMGFPIYDTEENLGREKLWKMDDDYVMKLPNISLPKLELTSSEMMALLLLWGRADIFKHTRIHTDITLAFNKLFSTLDQSRVQLKYFLTKPFQPPVLQAKLAEVFS